MLDSPRLERFKGYPHSCLNPGDLAFPPVANIIESGLYLKIVYTYIEDIMSLTLDHILYLDTLTEAYSYVGQGIVKQRIKLSRIQRVKKVHLHPEATFRQGLVLYLDPHGYTEIIPLPLSWNLFQKLKARGLFDV